jgi:hypothetical protein
MTLEHHRAGFIPRIAGLLLAVVAACACGQSPDGAEIEPLLALPEDELTEDEYLLEPPRADQIQSEPIEAARASGIQIEPLAEGGYYDAGGTFWVDLFEQDYAYLAVQLVTAEGRPVQGAVPEFSIEGSSRLLEPKAVSSQTATDEFGVVQFAVIGGKMGVDRVKVAFGDGSTEIQVNVISLEAMGFPALPEPEGGVPWHELMQAEVRYEGWTLFAEFPPEIAERAGKTVKVSGFMMPLEPDLKQRRFLLTSNPPSCFFHVPGGPAGAVEVFAPEGIEASWDAVVLEGRFEPQPSSEIGVVYRLHDARLVDP